MIVTNHVPTALQSEDSEMKQDFQDGYFLLAPGCGRKMAHLEPSLDDCDDSMELVDNGIYFEASNPYYECGEGNDDDSEDNYEC